MTFTFIYYLMTPVVAVFVLWKLLLLLYVHCTRDRAILFLHSVDRAVPSWYMLCSIHSAFLSCSISISGMSILGVVHALFVKMVDVLAVGGRPGR